MKKSFIIYFIFCSNLMFAQKKDAQSSKKKEYHVSAIGFYNLENLFDTVDGPNEDAEFLPNGARNWTQDKYEDKLNKLATVLSQMGTNVTPDGIAVLGCAEIENRYVLEDLVKQPLLKKNNFHIIHYDSPDDRGIDVGFLYNPKYFVPSYSQKFPVRIEENNYGIYNTSIKFDGKLQNDSMNQKIIFSKIREAFYAIDFSKNNENVDVENIEFTLKNGDNASVINSQLKNFTAVNSNTVIIDDKLFERATVKFTIKKRGYSSRDILWVKGLFKGEEMNFFINHWPSRRRGEESTRPSREKAAGICKHIIDSLMQVNPNSKAIVMGDLNDDPINTSCSKILNAKQYEKDVEPKGMFNPFFSFYRKGLGTMAYQDAWSLFDQIMISQPFLDKSQKGWYYERAEVFSRPYMVSKQGRFKGYPFRTFDGLQYAGGYSDHFPTLIYLFKAK